MAAVAAAGTRVYEPCHRFELEVPPDPLGTVLARLAACEAELRDTRRSGGSWLLEGELPARRVHEFQQRLPGLTRGEGAWSSRPHGDRPVNGPPPVRSRTDGNPLDRQQYLWYLRQHGLH
jgi:ribosomal protection tetracycline resistance protein